jgi:hypothetical protein
VVLPAGREAGFPPFSGRLRGHRQGRGDRARAHRPRGEAAGDRRREHARRLTLWERRLRQRRVRHGLRGDHVPARARRAADRNGRLELGRALRPYGREVQGDEGREPDLGRPQGRARHRLLPSREAAQPRGAAGRRVHHLVLPAQDLPAGRARWPFSRAREATSRGYRSPPWRSARPRAIARRTRRRRQGTRLRRGSAGRPARA